MRQRPILQKDRCRALRKIDNRPLLAKAHYPLAVQPSLRGEPPRDYDLYTCDYKVTSVYHLPELYERPRSQEQYAMCTSCYLVRKFATDLEQRALQLQTTAM